MSCPVFIQVLEFLDSDLEALIKAKGVVLAPGDIKAYMSMLLQALRDCHSNWVLHRDIKPNNMLISRDGEHTEGVAGALCRVHVLLHVFYTCYLPAWSSVQYRSRF